MPRYIFANGKVTVEEGVYTPFKQIDKQSLRGVLIFAKTLVKAGAQTESKDKENPDDNH